MDQLSHVIIMNTIILMVFQSTGILHVVATNHTVGGSTGWDLVSNLQNWSSSRTFYTGDNLEFIYGPTHDVLEVNQDAFNTCQKNAPISTHNDGDSIIPLDKLRSRYFICGTSGHCQSGLKMEVDVLSSPGNSSGDDTDSRRRPPQPQPPPSPKRPHSPPDKDHPSPEAPGPNSSSAAETQNNITGLFSLLPLIIMLIHQGP